MNQKTDAKQTVYDMLKGFSTAMFVTFGHDGRPSARPMHLARVEDGAGEVWFFTGKHGSLVEDLQRKGTTLLVMQNENSAYLSVHGQARIVQDKARAKELWSEPYKVWFPGGPEDPELALIAVALVDAEYWDNRGMNKLEYVFEAAKAYVQGKKPEVVEVDQHAKTSL